MIGVTVTEIGSDAIRAALERAPEAIRVRLIETLNELGKEAQERARAAAPYDAKRKAGVHLRDAVRSFAWADHNGKAELVVRAVGGARGAPHAHLIEYGVPAKKIRVYRKVYASKLSWLRDVGRWRFKRPTRVRNRKTFMYTRTHRITANPFFEPAIASLGDVGAQLQQSIDKAAIDAQANSLLANWDK